jgi:hypothetical protein
MRTGDSPGAAEVTVDVGAFAAPSRVRARWTRSSAASSASGGAGARAGAGPQNTSGPGVCSSKLRDAARTLMLSLLTHGRGDR